VSRSAPDARADQQDFPLDGIAGNGDFLTALRRADRLAKRRAGCLAGLLPWRA
jgi:hypothetical protein